MRDDLDFPVANLADGDVVTQVTRAAFDFDAIVQKLLERGEVEDLVGDGLGAVDCVLIRNLPALCTSLAFSSDF